MSENSSIICSSSLDNNSNHHPNPNSILPNCRNNIIIVRCHNTVANNNSSHKRKRTTSLSPNPESTKKSQRILDLFGKGGAIKMFVTGSGSESNSNDVIVRMSRSRDNRNMEALDVHEAAIMLPGPFVVLQGMPGDGMSNTVDSMPELEGYEPEDNINHHRQSSSSWSHSESAASETSFHQVTGEDEEEEGEEDGLFSSSVEVIPPPALHNDNNNNNNQQQDNDNDNNNSSDRVQIPVPPSSVAGMGYNSLLPLVGQANLNMASYVNNNNTPNNNNNNNSHVVASRVPPEDSFIVIPGYNSCTSSSCSSSFHHHHPQQQYAALSEQERRSLRNWAKQCRERECRQRDEVLLQANPQSGGSAGFCSSSMSMMMMQSTNPWWQKKGRLLVFPTIPTLTDKGVVEHHQTTTTTLPPGTTVMGTEIITIDMTSRRRHYSSVNSCTIQDNAVAMGVRGAYQFLKIESPYIGYVLFSMDGYSYLGPGLPSYYTEPEVWTWRVSCYDGAYVRQGLELTSVHVDTIPHGSFLRVSRKTVNSMGLSRLRVQAVLKRKSHPSPTTTTSNTEDNNNNDCNHNNNNDEEENDWNKEEEEEEEGTDHHSSSSHNMMMRRRIVSGWVSEALNPLSGQRGPVVQPVPFPIPALYRVTLEDGAVIRADVELSSPQIGHAPLRAILHVVGRAYSEHPMEQCIERLKLAGGGGWVSVRLNRPPPRDELVVEMVGIDGSFDPNEPGIYHLERRKQVLQEYHNNPNNSATIHRLDYHSTNNNNNNSNSRNDNSSTIRYTRNHNNRTLETSTGGDISSINDTTTDESEEGFANGLEASGELSNNTCSTLSSSAIPSLYRCGLAGDTKGKSSGSYKDRLCLICLTEERTATMVHGETGHIACCLSCARILKARGDRCPVCRLPIDSVIQQFWA